MKNLSIIFAVCFLLIGCTSKVIIKPDNLPTAIVGKPYNTEIKIQGGGTKISSSSFYIDISPLNGFKAEVIHTPEPYSSIRIYGKPESSIDTTIQIFGDTLGTSFPGKEFNKTYVIKVKESE